MPFLTKEELIATTYLIGMTIGAGVLALPYVFSQAGFLIGVIELLLTWVIVTVLTLCLGEIVLRTKDNHEVTGLAELYLGKKGKMFLIIISILYIYGALLAYGIGLGEAAYGLFGFDMLKSAIVIFLCLAAVVFFGLKTVTKAEVLLVPFIFIIIFCLFIFAYDKIVIDNFAGFEPSKILVPIAPLFFALFGLWCVPDMKRILKNKKQLKKTIILGVTVSAISYFLLAFLVVGVTGTETSGVFSVNLAKYVNPIIGKLTYLFTFFTISTSFLSIGFTLKEMLHEDYQWSNTVAWLVAFLIPFLLLLITQKGFVDVIAITGAFATVFVLSIIMLMFYKAKKTGKRKPEYVLNIPKPVSIFILLFCIFVALYTLWYYFLP